MWAVVSDSRRKKQCAMLSIATSFVAAKRSFSRRFAWSRWHKFSYLRNFDRSWSFHRCFWRQLRAIWAISRSRHQPWSHHRSVSCYRVNVNKPKLRNFERPLGLPGHLQWSFFTSATCHLFEIRRCGCVAIAAAISRGTTLAIAQT